jgi:hypothetical protein
VKWSEGMFGMCHGPASGCPRSAPSCAMGYVLFEGSGSGESDPKKSEERPLLSDTYARSAISNAVDRTMVVVRIRFPQGWSDQIAKRAEIGRLFEGFEQTSTQE